MTATELTSTVRALKELKLMAADIAADIETLEDRIKAEMTKRNTDELTVDVFKVRWTTMTSHRFDSAAFKLTHAALYQQYSKPVATRRFSIN
jgi:predicted phage-related endonuclease